MPGKPEVFGSQQSNRLRHNGLASSFEWVAEAQSLPIHAGMRTPIQRQRPRRRIKLVNPAPLRPIGREGPGRRFVNLVVAAIGLAFTLPLMLLLALLIKLTSRGPVLFKQMRIGLDSS